MLSYLVDGGNPKASDRLKVVSILLFYSVKGALSCSFLPGILYFLWSSWTALQELALPTPLASISHFPSHFACPYALKFSPLTKVSALPFPLSTRACTRLLCRAQVLYLSLSECLSPPTL